MISSRAVLNDRLIPELRFKEFEDNWKEVTLGAIGTTNGGLTYSPNDVVDEGKNGTLVLRSSNVQNDTMVFDDNVYVNCKITDKDLVRENDILLCVRNGSKNLIGKSLIIKKEHVGYAFGAFMAIYRSNSNPFIYHYFKSDRFFKQVHEHLGATINQITSKSLNSFKLNIPGIPEQIKIAFFLSTIDEKIRQLTRKKELLEQYKKGVMQQLFSGNLRFKYENGKTYPKWEEKTLYDISTDVSYGMNAAATEFDGVHKYLRITDIDVNSGKFKPNPLTSPEGTIDKKYKLNKNDIVFARTGASVGKSYLYNPKDGDLYYAGFLIKFSIINANSFFIYSLTLGEDYNKWVQIYSMRSGQPGLNAEEYKAFKIKLPCLAEQEKIATFLYGIDTKIESVTAQIIKTQTLKKGLLQQMFI